MKCWATDYILTTTLGILGMTWMVTVVFSQLDGDEDVPNFDEDGRDEYNEIHMLV